MDPLEVYIRQHSPWERLPKKIQQGLNNSKEAWHREVIQFSLKNQVRWSEGLVRQHYADEKKYYEQLVRMAKDGLMLYPYHLSDILVRGLRVSPFAFYVDMIYDLMAKEKSYDSLPNFTARDCVRLLGIGRNEYIDIVNQSKAAAKNPLWTMVARKKNGISDLLPKCPMDITIEPWWLVKFGFFHSDEVFSEEEQLLVNKCIVSKKVYACEADLGLLKTLHRKEAIYFDIPIAEIDCVSVPPLEGFVMNRVIGDTFETLLYKIFVSIDENTTIQELGNLLQIDVQLVKDAVSIYCRLGFAFKKAVELQREGVKFHTSWKSYMIEKREVGMEGRSRHDSDAALIFGDGAERSTPLAQKRVGFLFDSTLTAFLMMGNLSPGLKNHAVTMFEVGKLTDESLDSFLSELSGIREESEGDAQRYFEHAITLYKTLCFLRKNENLILNDKRGLALDMIRYESLYSLDPATCQRVLAKNYEILVSMTPVSVECKTLRSSAPIHIGPPIPEVNSLWFKLFLYHHAKSGPPSTLFVKGARVKRIPAQFSTFEKILLTPWDHESQVVSYAHCLGTLNEMLCHSAVLIQGHSESDHPSEPQLKDLPFPFDFSDPLYPKPLHETLQRLEKQLGLNSTCGYIRMIRLNRNVDDWVPLGIHFGIPLFDQALNKVICDRILTMNLFNSTHLRTQSRNSRELVLKLLHFIATHQNRVLELDSEGTITSKVALPTHNVSFDGKALLSSSAA